MSTTVKVLFVYGQSSDLDGYGVESLWANKEGNYYRINNIPFFIKNIAWGDLVSVENDEGELYYDDLIDSSGHSTIQLVILNDEDAIAVGQEFIELGCSWEGSHLAKLIAIDVPGAIQYNSIRTHLEKGEQTGRWDYREACLAHKS